jgi:hypothetical protein
VREAGYKNINKGCRKIRHIERGEAPLAEEAGLAPTAKHERRLRRMESGECRFPMLDEFEVLTEALDISGPKAFWAYQKECRYYDDGVAPTIVARLMPAVYNRVSYPKNLSTQDVIEFAMEFSADEGFKVCVTFDDGRALYIEPNGDRSETWQGPSMTIG